MEPAACPLCGEHHDGYGECALADLHDQPAATELQALLGVPDTAEGHGVQLPDA